MEMITGAIQTVIENGQQVIYRSKYGEKVPSNFTGKIEYSNGDQVWLVNGLTHREDGPAIIWANGEKRWHLNNHRVTPMEVFELLTPEQKEQVIWNLDEWR